MGFDKAFKTRQRRGLSDVLRQSFLFCFWSHNSKGMIPSELLFSSWHIQEQLIGRPERACGCVYRCRSSERYGGARALRDLKVNTIILNGKMKVHKHTHAQIFPYTYIHT